MLVDDRELTDRATRIDALIEEVEAFPDPAMRDKATEIVESLLLLYGEGLARILDHVVAQVDEAVSDRVLEAFASDQLVSHLLLLHDLHPVTVETRILRALEGVRPYLASHGGNVEFLGVEDGVARLRLEGSCSGCASSTLTLKLAIEEAILQAAPEIERIEAEGVVQPVDFFQSPDIIPLAAVRSASGPQWVALSDPPPSPGAIEGVNVAGVALVVINESDSLYAYRDACGACGGPIHEGILQGTELTCPSCGHRFDVRAAGRSLDEPSAHLEPVPLLERDGTVKVALATVGGGSALPGRR